MLVDTDNSDWVKDFQDQDKEYYIMRASDLTTINREIKSDEDLAWALRVTAQLLKDDEHRVVSTQRSKDGKAWLALCESSSST